MAGFLLRLAVAIHHYLSRVRVLYYSFTAVRQNQNETIQLAIGGPVAVVVVSWRHHCPTDTTKALLRHVVM